MLHDPGLSQVESVVRWLTELVNGRAVGRRLQWDDFVAFLGGIFWIRSELAFSSAGTKFRQSSDVFVAIMSGLPVERTARSLLDFFCIARWGSSFG